MHKLQSPVVCVIHIKAQPRVPAWQMTRLLLWIKIIPHVLFYWLPQGGAARGVNHTQPHLRAGSGGAAYLYTRPGVPTTTCTPADRMRASSRTLVPPTQA
jgi:hypothetical protein